MLPDPPLSSSSSASGSGRCRAPRLLQPVSITVRRRPPLPRGRNSSISSHRLLVFWASDPDLDLTTTTSMDNHRGSGRLTVEAAAATSLGSRWAVNEQLECHYHLRLVDLRTQI